MTESANPDAEALKALRLLGPDPQNWVPARSGLDHDVTIVGGGQTGAAFAFALRRAGIGNFTVIDAAADEARSGVWLTRARMKKLRTPKNLVGPELGVPALSFQSWYEAHHGEEAYSAIDHIARTDWADYLSWFRKFLAIPVRYRTRLLAVEPAEGHFRLRLDVDGAEKIETTRKIILGTGVAGTGAPFVPEVVAENLPSDLYAHTAHAIDFDRLKGKVVAVLGAAASAFDAAAVALEAGAARVHLFARRPAIAAVPITRVRAYPGASDNYYDLPDALRWRLALRFRQYGSTPPIDAVERVTKFSNFHLHLRAPWTAARAEQGQIAALAGGDEFRFDFAIAGTGYLVDPSARPELGGFAHEIALWRDRYQPPVDEEDPALASHPYLGGGYQYVEKAEGAAPFLKNIHVFNTGGFVSFGKPVGDVPSLKGGVPTLVARISRDLFFADFDVHSERFRGDAAPDFTEELYASAIWKRPTSVAAE